MAESVIILILFLGLCVLGMPIGFSIGFTTWTAFVMLDGSMIVLAQKMFSGINSFSYLCIPLFLLAAEIMSRGNLIQKIGDFFNVLIGHVRGGLAYVNVLNSMVFAGISGSATADMASLGLIEANMMHAAGYDKAFATCVSAASATIAPLIPPSTVMIIFASAIGGISIGKLFMGGLIPGILFGISQMVLCAIYAKKYQQKAHKRSSFQEVAQEFVHVLPVLVLPAIIMGSIVTGICTATEAGAIAVLYAIIITFVQKTMDFKKMYLCLVSTAKLTASVLFLISTASAMGWVVTALQIPQSITRFCLQYIGSAGQFLIFLNILLLVVGCLMECAPATLLLAPILYPVAMSYGIDPIHFGIVFCMNLTIGLITPPIGLMLFVGSNVTGVKLSLLYKRIWPFVCTELIVLLVITYVPFLSTWLPGVMG